MIPSQGRARQDSPKYSWAENNLSNLKARFSTGMHALPIGREMMTDED